MVVMDHPGPRRAGGRDVCERASHCDDRGHGQYGDYRDRGCEALSDADRPGSEESRAPSPMIHRTPWTSNTRPI